MKTKTIIIAVFAAVAVALGATTIVLINQPANNQPQQAEQSQAQPIEDKQQVTYTAEYGKNILDQLKAKATVITKDSSLGPYVDSINGTQGGTDGKYWSFYVDGALSEVGANDFVAKGGEVIDWKFE